MLSYPVAVGRSEAIYEAKKNRFIAIILPIEKRDALAICLGQIKREYPDARHYCYGFMAGAPDDGPSHGFSDDGEPSGTAGKPILALLKGAGIGHVLAVVVRYSSGIKLGTGGLVKAYSSATKLALAHLPTDIYVQKSTLVITLSYERLKDIEHYIAEVQGVISDAVYAADIQLTVEIPVEIVERFVEQASRFATVNEG